MCFQALKSNISLWAWLILGLPKTIPQQSFQIHVKFCDTVAM